MRKLESYLASSSLKAPSPISAALRTPLRYYPDYICLKTTSAP
jgi:hypothetical protein